MPNLPENVDNHRPTPITLLQQPSGEPTGCSLQAKHHEHKHGVPMVGPTKHETRDSPVPFHCGKGMKRESVQGSPVPPANLRPSVELSSEVCQLGSVNCDGQPALANVFSGPAMNLRSRHRQRIACPDDASAYLRTSLTKHSLAVVSKFLLTLSNFPARSELFLIRLYC